MREQGEGFLYAAGQLGDVHGIQHIRLDAHPLAVLVHHGLGYEVHPPASQLWSGDWMGA